MPELLRIRPHIAPDQLANLRKDQFLRCPGCGRLSECCCNPGICGCLEHGRHAVLDAATQLAIEELPKVLILDEQAAEDSPAVQRIIKQLMKENDEPTD